MTKKEMFKEIAKVNADNQEIVDFCNHEIALLEKKASSSRKPTKTQVENEGYKQAILDILADSNEPLTISDMLTFDSLAGLKNQRVSALVTQLKNKGLVVREEIKKKAYFSLA